ncbi:MAG: histidine phosphatase family protein [Pseudomonadota bacterium]
MLFLTRHGQTEMNCSGRLIGRKDSHLTDRGKDQAHRVGQKLRSLIGEGPVSLWASPLGRAQATASILCQYIDVPTIHTDDRLAEIGLGDWEGMTMEDIEFTSPGALDGTDRFDWAYRAPKGESEAAFFERLQSWIDEIDFDAAPVIAVSHGWAGMGLRSLYLNQPFAAVTSKGDSHEAVFEFANGTITEH